VASPLERVEFHSCAIGKAFHDSVWNVGIVVGVEHHYFGWRNFGSVMRWIVKGSAIQLFPILFR
jgi:hypothetical protein